MTEGGARDARSVGDRAAVALMDEREAIRNDVETGGDEHRRAGLGAGHGPQPVAQRAVTNLRPGLRGLELGPRMADGERLDPAGRIVVERQMAGREKRQGQAGREGRQRNPGSHTKGDRPDHLNPLYGCVPEASSHPPAGTAL